MFNQNRILKVFQLISQLKLQPPKSVKLMAKQFESSERTIYRYLDLLQALGFELKKDDYNRFYIPSVDHENATLFTPQEASFIKNLVLQFAPNHALTDVVIRKLQLETNLQDLSNKLTKVHLGKVIEHLSTAIENKQQVVLKNYFSVNSNTVSNRLIEPIAFANNYQYVCAYEPESSQNKFFAIERIKAVKLTTESFKFSDLHLLETLDFFSFSKSDFTHTIDILMNLRAYVLFVETYPSSASYFKETKTNIEYRLQAEIHNPKPMARFVKGLPNDLTVLGNEAFLAFLDTY